MRLFLLATEECQLWNKERRTYDLSGHWGDVAILHRGFTRAQSVSLGSRITEPFGSTVSLPPVVFALMRLIIHSSFLCARYFRPDDCHFECSVVFKECAYDSIRQICVQRQLVPNGIVIEIIQKSWMKCLLILFFVSKATDNISAFSFFQLLIL
ncbi:hypothetical protein MJG53_003480 [Ovis ammon polii x Ovis aries]|uniref:Uncharacterized protein n=1 Tax=Ovis ammon polii x Ovis aries TaxID=2918886 RepID=A0ACB9VHB6_9CETA|nr:hypothetical protein MJG53_003480 [Ovis ammon polii x Ovis aries]